MFTILQKEIRAFVKDRRAMMLGLLMPIILISVFSVAFGGIGSTKDSRKSLLVCDEDKSKTSIKAVANLDSNKALAVDSVSTVDSAFNLVKTGKYAEALIFHKGFGDSVKALKHLPWELKYDAAQSIQMQMMQQYLIGVLQNIGRIMAGRKAQQQFAGMDSMDMMIATMQMKKTMENSTKGLDDLMKLNASPVAIETDKQGVVQAVAGTAVMMLLFSLTAMGGRILEEKENGTLKRLLYSPLTATQILSGKMLTAVLYATIQLLIMFTFSWLAFGLAVPPKIAPVFLLIVATAFACSGFGMFLASIIKSREQLNGLSTLAVLCMSAIGGSMVPSFLMPPWMQMVGHVSINYWSIQGFYDIFSRQIPITDFIFLNKVIVLFFIGGVLSIISFVLFRRNATSLA